MNGRIFFIFMAAAAFFIAGPALRAAEIHDAVRSNRADRVREILKETDGGAARAVIGDGITPLHLAAAVNAYACAAELLINGADVNARTEGGFTPLHWAANKDSLETARLLIQNGADINAATPQGVTPLHWAAAKNAARVIQLLIAAGADVTRKTDKGLTPLHWAVDKDAGEASLALALQVVSMEMPSNLVAAADSTEMPAMGVAPGTRPAEDVKTLVVDIGLGVVMDFVWLDPLHLWFGKYEVTNAQFCRFRVQHKTLSREGYQLDGPNQPVADVSWDDAEAFVKWLTRNYSGSIPLNCEFRLATSKEWETAARCGDGRIYPWGNDWPPRYGNFADLAAREHLQGAGDGVRKYDDGFIVACPVRDSGCNEWGIYGLAGNVWEWCQDWSDETHKYRVRRGGSWDFDPEKTLRVDFEGFDLPDTRYDNIGIRVVVAPKASVKP